jgi:hypothetical protein
MTHLSDTGTLACPVLQHSNYYMFNIYAQLNLYNQDRCDEEQEKSGYGNESSLKNVE